MPKFGKKLRALREYHELSYRQLGAALKYNHSHFAKIESGERMPSYELVVKIAKYFEVSFDELMDDEVELRKLS